MAAASGAAAQSRAYRRPHQPGYAHATGGWRQASACRAVLPGQRSWTPTAVMSLSDPHNRITSMASWIEAGISRVCGACGSQRPAADRKKVTSLALSRRRPRVRVPSLPSAAARSAPLRPAHSVHAAGRADSLPVTFLLTTFAVRRAPASAGHWAIVRTRPAQQVEVVQARWSDTRCRLLAFPAPTITGSPPLGRPHCAGSARLCSSSRRSLLV